MIVIAFAVLGFLYWWNSFVPYSSSISVFQSEQKTKYLKAQNKKLRLEKQHIEQRISTLQDSIQDFNTLISVYYEHIPEVKKSLSEIEEKKNQARIANDFSAYIAQDSIYMDSISGLILVYEQVIAFQKNKSTVQDSVISSYIEKEGITTQIFENTMNIVKSRHKEELEKLEHKLKRVKRQRNISLALNGVLGALLFWKK